MTSSTLHQSLAQLESELNQVFLERSDLIRILLTSIVAQANGAMLGPPGTGKTTLVKTVAGAFSGKSWYQLLDATSTPDQILGAVDINALLQGQGFRRDLSGGLAAPDVLIGIGDEAFKCNAPTLNALLGVTLDREITNGGIVVKCGLNSFWACSNELPQEETLAAFWDRLSLRYWVSEVSRTSKRLLMLRRAGIIPTPTVTVQISPQDLQQMQQEALQIPLDEMMVDSILDIGGLLEKDHNLTASTRKHHQIVDLIRCYAYVCGDTECDEDHLAILEHILWNQPEERALVKKAIKKFGNPLATQANSILEAAKTIFNSLPSYTTDTNRGQWMRDIGSGDMQLAEMEQKLDGMCSTTVKAKRLRKVKQAKAEITQMRSRIQNMIPQAYSLPSR